MRNAPIRMNEIPFAPLGETIDTARLADPIPPSPIPPAPLPVKRPRAHRLIAWRHDGGLRDTAFETLELAQEAAEGLHWAIYWKYAIQCGRDMVARALIEVPAGDTP